MAAGTPIDAHGADHTAAWGGLSAPFAPSVFRSDRVNSPRRRRRTEYPRHPQRRRGGGECAPPHFSAAICSIFCSPTAGAGNTRLIFSAAIGRGLVRSPTADYPRKEQPRSPTAQGISSPPLPARSRPSKRIRAFCLSPAGKTLLKNSLLRISKHYLISVYNPLN